MEFASLKTLQANSELYRPSQTLAKNIFEKDLKILKTKKSANQVLEYAESENSNIYKYTTKLLKSETDLSHLQKAIDFQSKSLGTSKNGLFFNLIANNKELIFGLKSHPENIKKMKSKVKAFLLALKSKEKEKKIQIKDEDVLGEDKESQRMSNYSIIEKLNSVRLSNVQKVIIALIIWDYIKMLEEGGGAEEEKHKTIEEYEEREKQRKAAFEEEIRRLEEKEKERKRQEKEIWEAKVKKWHQENAEKARKQKEKEIWEAKVKKWHQENAEKARKQKEKAQRKAKEEYDELHRRMKEEKPKHDAYVKSVENLYDNLEKSDKIVSELFNKLNLRKTDSEDVIFWVHCLRRVKKEVNKRGVNTEAVKKFLGEFIWINYLRELKEKETEKWLYEGEIDYIFDVLLIGRYVCRGASTSSLKTFCFSGWGSDSKIFSEILFTLGPQIHIFYETNSVNKMKNVLATIEQLNKALDSVNDNDSFKVMAKAMREFSLEPWMEKIKQKIKEKEAEPKKEKRTYERDPDKIPDGASEDGRYVPYYGSNKEHKNAGTGLFGTVNVYWDTEKKCKVAIKTIYRGKKDFDPKKIESLKKIDCPYVAKLYKITTLIIGGKKVPGLVMEYVHGHTSFIDQTYRLPKDQLFEICKQLIDAFEAFNNAGFDCTGDGHFGNILMNKSGGIKIVDYDDTSETGGSSWHNRASALIYIISALSAHRNGDEIREKFLEKFPELEGEIGQSEMHYNTYYVKLPTTCAAPSFNELRTALDELEKEV